MPDGRGGMDMHPKCSVPLSFHFGMQSTPQAGYHMSLPPPNLLAPQTEIRNGSQRSEISSQNPVAVYHDNFHVGIQSTPQAGYHMPLPPHALLVPQTQMRNRSQGSELFVQTPDTIVYDNLHVGMHRTPQPGNHMPLPPPAQLVPQTQIRNGSQGSEISSSSVRFGLPRPDAFFLNMTPSIHFSSTPSIASAPAAATAPFDQLRNGLPPTNATQDQEVPPTPQHQHALNSILLNMLQSQLANLSSVQPAPAIPPAMPALPLPTSKGYAEALSALPSAHSICGLSSSQGTQQGSSTAESTNAPDFVEVFPRKKRGLLGQDNQESLILDKNALAALYHLPLKEAAEALGICPTAIKAACRKLGLPKWPYRKIRKQSRRRAMLAARARSSNTACTPP